MFSFDPKFDASNSEMTDSTSLEEYPSDTILCFTASTGSFDSILVNLLSSSSGGCRSGLRVSLTSWLVGISSMLALALAESLLS